LSTSSSFRFIAKFVIPVALGDGPGLGMPVIVRNIASSIQGEAR
jgi:hypothetical protein